MNDEANKKTVRMRVTLTSEENPLLTEALIGARQGRARHARLLTLASLGLMAERQMSAMDGTRAPDKPRETRTNKRASSGSFSQSDIDELEGAFGGRQD